PRSVAALRGRAAGADRRAVRVAAGEGDVPGKTVVGVTAGGRRWGGVLDLHGRVGGLLLPGRKRARDARLGQRLRPKPDCRFLLPALVLADVPPQRGGA